MAGSLYDVIGWNPEWWGPKSSPENLLFVKTLSEIVYGGKVVVDMGCGNQKVNTRLTGVDAYDDAADIKAYMWDTPFEDNSVDGLICFHALEHISKFQVVPTIREFQRILKPGARFLILVPNLIWCMEKFIEAPDINWRMDTIFGIQTNDGQYHKTGFTESIIRQYWTALDDCEIEAIHHVHAYAQQNFGIVTRKKEKE